MSILKMMWQLIAGIAYSFFCPRFPQPLIDFGEHREDVVKGKLTRNFKELNNGKQSIH